MQSLVRPRTSCGEREGGKGKQVEDREEGRRGRRSDAVCKGASRIHLMGVGGSTPAAGVLGDLAGGVGPAGLAAGLIDLGVGIGVGIDLGVGIGVGIDLGVGIGVGIDLGVDIDLEVDLEPKSALRAPFRALSGQLAPLGRNLIPRT